MTVKSYLRKWIRPIYMRFPFLRTARQKYLYVKSVVKLKLQFWKDERTNLLALQALSDRRFTSQPMAAYIPSGLELPVIDITVVAYNSQRWITPFFATLAVQAYPLSKINLFIVDHGSTDSTIDQINSAINEDGNKFRSVHLMHQANGGFGAGHHRAIMAGSAELVLVTNLDLEFFEQSIGQVVDEALKDKKSEVASWELRQIPYEHPKYYDPVTLETNWSSHACILIRRSAYHAVGGYDPKIFMYTEDVELSYRFRSHGYTLKYVPKAVVNHFTYETAGQVKPLQYVGSALGNVYIRLRYGSIGSKLVGFMLYGARFFLPSPFAGAKILLLKNISVLVSTTPHFLKGKGTAKGHFPVNGFDYELTRDGAFYPISPVLQEHPLVTVIMRTYQGRGMFLRQAMLSVFNQTYSPIELIVVEDGGASQKETVDALGSREGCEVRFFSNPKLGRSAAGNTGLAEAKGKYVMFLDDDDLLFSDHVEILVQKLSEKADLKAAYSLAFEVQTKVEVDNSSYTECNIAKPAVFYQEWDYDQLLDHNFIPIQGILFNRELFETHGGFDMALDQLEDWNLWLRYGFESLFSFVPKTTSLFRSPADFKVRKARQDQLHNAYYEARTRAISSLQQS